MEDAQVLSYFIKKGKLTSSFDGIIVNKETTSLCSLEID
jgi:hypothetical protein